MFGARFVMCNWVFRPLDSLLSMVMREGETLKTYSDRYWETFNKIDGDVKDVAIRTFTVGLPIKHDLRKSITMKPARSMCQLMDRIDSISGLRRIKLKGRVRLICFPLERGILGQEVIITTGLGENSLTSHCGLT